jgi:phosphomannomutase/phosphoglucomutase
MYDEINKIGKSIMYKTGHSNLKVRIAETNADLAAEVSGHIFFNDKYFGYDDAIYATLRVLELIKKNINLDDEIKKLPKLFSTDELKINTTEEKKFEIIKDLKEYLKKPDKNFPEIISIIDIDGLRINFKNGWGLVRASNTTPLLVTRFEATNEKDLQLYQNQINKLIESVKNVQK